MPVHVRSFIVTFQFAKAGINALALSPVHIGYPPCDPDNICGCMHCSRVHSFHIKSKNIYMYCQFSRFYIISIVGVVNILIRRNQPCSSPLLCSRGNLWTKQVMQSCVDLLLVRPHVMQVQSSPVRSQRSRCTQNKPSPVPHYPPCLPTTYAHHPVHPACVMQTRPEAIEYLRCRLSRPYILGAVVHAQPLPYPARACAYIYAQTRE
jgi:hypothetical protein